MPQYANIERMRKMIARTSPGDMALHNALHEVQQYLLYAASDDVFFGSVDAGKREAQPKGITLAGAQALIDKVRMSEYARMHWPKFAAGARTTVDNDTSAMENTLDFILSHDAGAKYAGAFTDDDLVKRRVGGAQMHLADNGFAMQPAVVLHELGHAVEAFERPNSYHNNGEAHGAAFARTMIQLVHEFLSVQKAKELEAAFAYAGVEVAPAIQSQPHRELR